MDRHRVHDEQDVEITGRTVATEVKENAMNLIDTYVSEVGRRLPAKQRTDIEAEIRSVLQDMLDERSQKAGKPVDEEMTLQVLKEYGAPDKVAATYLGERYLIGPRLYPIFMLVVRIALTVIGVLAAIGVGIALYQTTLNLQDVLVMLVKTMANFAASAMTVLGNVVLVFAIIEWALYSAGAKGEIKGLPKEKEWDPRSLFKLSGPNQVRMGETIVEIVGSFAAIVIFNFYPQLFSFTPSLNGVVESGNWAIGFSNAAFVPLLSEAFFYFVPYLTIVWALTILLDIVLLRMGTWNTLTRSIFIGLKVISLMIAAGMLAAPSLIALTAASVAGPLGSLEAGQTLVNMLNLFIKAALWLGIFGTTVEIIKAIARMVTSKSMPYSFPEKN
jgi:hypothetical protein